MNMDDSGIPGISGNPQYISWAQKKDRKHVSRMLQVVGLINHFHVSNFPIYDGCYVYIYILYNYITVWILRLAEGQMYHNMALCYDQVSESIAMTKNAAD